MRWRTRTQTAIQGWDVAGMTAGRVHAGRTWQWAVRLLGAALLLGMAWIHEDLYALGYATVPTIGPLFRLNALLGVAVAVAVLLTPLPWWRLACAAGAVLQLGTLAALVQSLTVGAFGFHETVDAPLIGRTFVVEVLGFVVLALGAAVRAERQGAREPAAAQGPGAADGSR